MISTRNDALALIRRNIARSGFHIYAINGGALPRFVYTIGLRSTLGAELIFGGGVDYDHGDVGKILHSLRMQLATATWDATFEVPRHGVFTLRKIHRSWGQSLLLGAIDYYNVRDVDAYQVVPAAPHATIDVPNMSVPWSPTVEPVWRWMRGRWPYDVPEHSYVIANRPVLQGAPITRAERWGRDEWAMFGGTLATRPEDARVIPLGSLLALDPTLRPVIDLPLDGALWRVPSGAWQSCDSN